jgi:hypothetical protein
MTPASMSQRIANGCRQSGGDTHDPFGHAPAGFLRVISIVTAHRQWIEPRLQAEDETLLWIPSRGFHLCDLLVVTHGMERCVDEPLVPIQGSEGGVLNGELLQGRVRLARKPHDF